MSEHIQYICSNCGEVHEEWPALAYTSPDNYAMLTQDEKDEMGVLDADFCIINYPDHTDRFIRCTLNQKVIDHCEDLSYGLWVSLSEKSFNDYSENYNNETHETGYFGWLCNSIPEYQFNASIPMNVFTKNGNQRPEIIPHTDSDHPFVKDYFKGITKAEAENRIRAMLEGIEKADTPGVRKRPWWKIW